MISTVGQNDNISKVKLSEFPSQKELMEKELEARSRGISETYLLTFTIIYYVYVLHSKYSILSGCIFRILKKTA